MSIRGRWRVVETPDYDMATPASYIFFGKTSGEFALDCLTGSIHGGYEGDAVEFTWEGNDEMEPARGDGWAELQDDGSLEGEISLETATTSPSSLAERSLLQHPARSLVLENGYEEARHRGRVPLRQSYVRSLRELPVGPRVLEELD